ncbi:porin [Burkholderia multivorans]|uniref:porin n=1 Tax=Burkholderia multivorans TaxID=87883 RepID=UPI00209F023B|nr:porin [Burkholderia multivorans]MCO8612090.1 porin [Burkholderia multivorans]MCO8638439.1 porin [Burkholderia multivorans]
MRLRLTAIAASALVLSQTATAQSTVTLYGIIDTGVQYYNNAAAGGSVVGMPSLTGSVPSRFGFRGVEELGGGFKAFFNLESGFAVSTGQLNNGGRLFGRLANVGLATERNTVTLGRQLNMTYYAIIPADVMGPAIHSIASFDPYIPNARSDNAVGYQGRFGAFNVGATYSFGRDAAGPAGPAATNCGGQLPGDFVACRQYTAMLSYQTTQFGVATSYDVMRGGPNASAPLSSSGFTDTRNLVDAFAMAGPVKVAGGWLRRNTAAAIHAQSDIFFLGFEYFIRPDLVEDVQALRYINRGVANANLFVSRTTYLLSKRTSAYMSLGYIMNSDKGNAPVAALGTVRTGANQFGAMIGLQQKF